MKKDTMNNNQPNGTAKVKLKTGERLDDLQYNGLHIIQNKNLYCFSSDAVLLCNFVKAMHSDTIVDLCSGSGVVGILAKAKTNAKQLIMIEKQKELADMCKRSLQYNNIKDAEVFCCDIKNCDRVIKNKLGIQFVDVVCVNPPYYLPTQKKMSGNIKIDMAKFELKLSLNSICKTANKLLKYGGKFFMINDSERIAELLATLSKNDLEPKVIEFVYPKQNKHSNVVLIEAVKGGKPGTKVFYKQIWLYFGINNMKI